PAVARIRLHATRGIDTKRRHVQCMRWVVTGPPDPRRVLTHERLGVDGPQAWIGDAISRRGHELPGGDHGMRRRRVFGIQSPARGARPALKNSARLPTDCMKPSRSTVSVVANPSLTGYPSRAARIAGARRLAHDTLLLP